MILIKTNTIWDLGLINYGIKIKDEHNTYKSWSRYINNRNKKWWKLVRTRVGIFVFNRVGEIIFSTKIGLCEGEYKIENTSENNECYGK